VQIRYVLVKGTAVQVRVHYGFSGFVKGTAVTGTYSCRAHRSQVKCTSVKQSSLSLRRLSVCVSVFLSLCLCVVGGPSIQPSIQSIHPSTNPSVRLSVCSSVFLPVCLSVCLCVCLSTYPSVCVAGCALVAHKMLMRLSHVAENLSETELMEDLRVNAE
jgi:hypothetical protein